MTRFHGKIAEKIILGKITRYGAIGRDTIHFLMFRW